MAKTTPIFAIIKYIVSLHEKELGFNSSSLTIGLKSLIIINKLEDEISDRMLDGWQTKKNVTIYHNRAEALAKLFKQFNSEIEPFWFKVDSLREFKFLWGREAQSRMSSRSKDLPARCYTLIKKSFSGSERYVFELLHTYTKEERRMFDLYVPHENPDTGDVAVEKFSGEDFDIGNTNILRGRSVGITGQPDRARDIHVKHEGEDAILNRYRFALSIGSSPFNSEPVAARVYCERLGDFESVGAKLLTQCVRYANEEDIYMVSPILADLIIRFINGPESSGSLMSFNTEKLNEEIREAISGQDGLVVPNFEEIGADRS